MRNVLAVVAILAFAGIANANPTSSTIHGANSHDLDGLMSSYDLIQGMIGTELPGDMGWHPANGDPLDKLPALTDGIGVRPTGLTGLLNDFPAPLGSPVKLVRYDLPAASNVGYINVYTGNNGKDGRIFSTTVVKYSTDNGANYSTLGYFQSDPSGTINAGSLAVTRVRIYDDANPILLAGVTNLEFDLYSVDNTGGQMRDPFDGVNPFTSTDDLLSAAFVSPLVWEIDVAPEPASLTLLVIGGLAAIRRRR